jgi:hypothetical protein
MGEAVFSADSRWLSAPLSDLPGTARLVTTPGTVRADFLKEHCDVT